MAIANAALNEAGDLGFDQVRRNSSGSPRYRDLTELLGVPPLRLRGDQQLGRQAAHISSALGDLPPVITA
jgi:hypothetical protein